VKRSLGHNSKREQTAAFYHTKQQISTLVTSAVVCSQFERKYTLKGQFRNKKCRTASSWLKNSKITTFSPTQENVLWCMNYIREPCCRPITSRFFISSICGSNSLDCRLDICACNVCRFFVFSTFCIILIFFTLLLILTIFLKKMQNLDMMSKNWIWQFFAEKGHLGEIYALVVIYGINMVLATSKFSLWWKGRFFSIYFNFFSNF